jgi:hypothetical protein
MIKNAVEIGGGQRLENVDPASRKEGRNYLKGRVFRRGADQRDEAVFNAVEQGILLCLVEAVDFVDEQNGPFARQVLILLRPIQDLPNVSDSGGDRA